MAGKIDFAAINAAALSQFANLVADWLPGGKRSGSEYSSLNPTRSDSRAGSFSINVNTGCWMDFATDDSGSDPISLYAYLFCDNDQGAAAKGLAELVGIVYQSKSQGGRATPSKSGSSGSAPHSQTRQGDKPAERAVQNSKPGRESPWAPIVPDHELEKPIWHSVRGLPESIFTYRGLAGELLGYVYRFRTSEGGKEVLPLTWCRHGKTQKTEWRFMQWAEPRPLYGLERLGSMDPDATVLVVEGEKCADVGNAQLSQLACVSWPGGGKVPDKADWSHLSGRKVVIWPDCDSQREKFPKDAEPGFVPAFLPADKQPGHKTAVAIADILTDLGCKVWLVSIPEPGITKNGWDIADAVADGCAGGALADFIRANSRPLLLEFAEKTVSPPGAACAGGGDSGGVSSSGSGAGDPPGDGPGQGPWWSDGLMKKARGGFEPSMSNISKILRQHSAWKGSIGYNEFAHSIERLLPIPWSDKPGVWEISDDLRLNEWLADNIDLYVKSQSTIADGVALAAYSNMFHPVRSFLLGLPAWDGIARLDCYLSDVIDAENTPFLRLAGRGRRRRTSPWRRPRTGRRVAFAFSFDSGRMQCR